MPRIALCQFNASVGDITGNTAIMRTFIAQAIVDNADLVIFPEMSICGYPPEDLLLKKHFLTDTRAALEHLAADNPNITLIAGFAELSDNTCFNSIALTQSGRIKTIYRKTILPNYGVFDERRYFQPGSTPAVVKINGITAALTICEDIWQLDTLTELLKDTPEKDIIINISASPFHVGKINLRCELLTRCAKNFNCPVAYCNLVGGQDELVFDGRSMFIDRTGNLFSQAESFEEDILIADLDSGDDNNPQLTNIKSAAAAPDIPPPDQIAEIYSSLVLGTRDYVRKNGFKKVIIGLSGGIDSSLTAAIAADALGPENVIGVTMPSKFNTPETIADAQELAKNLNIEFHTIPIADTLQAFDKTLALAPGWSSDGIAYENLQARIRGCILMSLSNQLGHLVLTTGNKSETAVGYSTLYGDTAGGFAVIKDVPKTMVFDLALYLNKTTPRQIIPPSVIDRPPSAELKADQKDSDSLPDYDLLDKILRGYIEQHLSPRQLSDQGLDENIVKKVIKMVDRSEHKRRQSPPGVKITPRAFGKDHRMPITNKYRPKP